MPVTLNSRIMGAVPNEDKPDGLDKSDVVFYIIFIVLMAFAWVADKYL